MGTWAYYEEFWVFTAYTHSMVKYKAKGVLEEEEEDESWLKNFRVWFNTSTLFRAAVNKVRIAIMLINIPNG